jgi:TonB family protein
VPAKSSMTRRNDTLSLSLRLVILIAVLFGHGLVLIGIGRVWQTGVEEKGPEQVAFVQIINGDGFSREKGPAPEQRSMAAIRSKTTKQTATHSISPAPPPTTPLPVPQVSITGKTSSSSMTPSSLTKDLASFQGGADSARTETANMKASSGSAGGTSTTGAEGNEQGSSGGGRVKTIAESEIRYRYQAKPIYPLASRRAREEGSVTLIIEIDTEGRVNDYKILRSSGISRLDRAALDAAQKSSFYPYVENGSAIRVRLSVPYVFSLKGNPGDQLNGTTVE